MSGKYQHKDKGYHQAKEQGYRCRAALKLLEIQKKYNLIRKGNCVVDLGCDPGGWLQVAGPLVGDSGLVIGVDLVKSNPLPNSWVKIIQGDFLQSETLRLIDEELSGRHVQVVLSDMSPKLTGIRFADIAASCELVESALEFCKAKLQPNGWFVAKVFPGQETEDFHKQLKSLFKVVNRSYLDSSRKTSSEFYFICQGFQNK